MRKYWKEQTKINNQNRQTTKNWQQKVLTYFKGHLSTNVNTLEHDLISCLSFPCLFCFSTFSNQNLQLEHIKADFNNNILFQIKVTQIRSRFSFFFSYNTWLEFHYYPSSYHHDRKSCILIKAELTLYMC